MKYNPDFHPNHGKPFTLYDRAYMCYYYDIDGRVNVSLALGRTESTIASKMTEYKRKGWDKHYKQLWEYIQYRGWRSNGDSIEEVDPEEIH